MAIREFVFTHSPAARVADHFASLGVKSNRNKQPVSVSAANPKGVRKAKGLVKHPCASVTWYESEDRTMPSVSSF